MLNKTPINENPLQTDNDVKTSEGEGLTVVGKDASPTLG